MLANRSIVVLALFAAGGCSSPGPGREDRPAPTAFTDVALEAGLSRQTPSERPVKHILESTGSGVAVGDFDGDGLEDLYFTQQPTVNEYLAGRPGRANELYRNNGDGTFTEVGKQAGVSLHAWSNAAYFADYDNDGDQDLLVLNWGANNFYANNGDGTFTDITASSGLAGRSDGWASAAAFGDLDRDGFLDLFVVNYCSYDPENPSPASSRPMWQGLDVYVGPVGLPGQADTVYRNRGDGSFADISESAGLERHPKLCGLGVVMQDLDRDQDLDLYVANDATVNQLWRNDGRMPLMEVGAMSGTATNEDAMEQAGMGVDAADYDNDGFIDLFVTNFSHEWNALYVSEGGLRFRDATFEAGLSGAWKYLGWGTKFFDFDHDGRLDLGIANGHVYPQVDVNPGIGTSYRQANQLLRNAGNGKLEPVEDAAWNEERSSRGLALIDYDTDGDLDVVLTHIDAAPSLLRNDVGNRRNWISIRLEGTDSNRDGIGARLELEIGDATLTRIVNPFGSYQSQSTAAVHFGLADTEYIDRLTIYWPSMRTYSYEDLQANRFYTIRERSGVVAVREPSTVTP